MGSFISNQIHIDLILFLISFLLIFYARKFINVGGSKNEEQILQRRIKMLAKQQEELLESVTKVSTFAQANRQDFGLSDNSKLGIADYIKKLMKEASITEIAWTNFSIYCLLGGGAFTTFIVYFNFLSLLMGVPVGMFVGAYLTYSFFGYLAQKKKSAFLKLFPDAIDMMIRGVKAGLNIGRVMKLVSMESRDPIASEFRTISQKFELGIEPEKVLVEAAERIDIEEFRFLVVALVLQLENGGVLGEILNNLAGVVRKRLELNLKLKAMSAEARMSAIVLSALPFAFAGIMCVINPEHLKEFLKPGTGQTLLKVFLTLFAMGAFFMLKATKIKV